MDEFVASENVKRFRQQLIDCTDAQQRRTLEQLLADEEAKLRKLEPPKANR